MWINMPKKVKTNACSKIQIYTENLVCHIFLVNLKTSLTFCRKLIYIIKVFDRNKTCQRKLNNKKLVAILSKRTSENIFFREFLKLQEQIQLVFPNTFIILTVFHTAFHFRSKSYDQGVYEDGGTQNIFNHFLLNKLTRNISNKHKWDGLTRGFIL